MKIHVKVWHPVAELFVSEKRYQFDYDVAPGTTLGQLLSELAEANPAWRTGVWCEETGLSADIFLSRNGIFLRPDWIATQALEDNDVIGVRRLLHGG